MRGGLEGFWAIVGNGRWEGVVFLRLEGARRAGGGGGLDRGGRGLSVPQVVWVCTEE